MWFRKIYAGILIDSVCRVSMGLIDDEQGDFREWKGCVDQMFTIKHMGEKPQRNKLECMWVLYYWVNREAL